MKKILVSMMTIALVSALIGGGIYAAFGDTEKVENNIFQAGTIDLHVNENPIWSTPLGFQNKLPGHLANITFKNYGTLDGILKLGIGDLDADDHVMALDDKFEFYNDRGASDRWLMSFNAYARLIYVELDGASWESSPDANNDGKVSLYELVAGSPTFEIALDSEQELTLSFYLGHSFKKANENPITDTDMDDLVGAETWENIGRFITGGDFHIINTGPPIWNVPQADGIEFTITAFLSPAD